MTKEIKKQYKDLKAKHPHALLLFRSNDFYEAYEEDAKVCARILGLTLTMFSGGLCMVAFPYHALHSYLTRLIRAGYRIAIADKLEEPRPKCGITERKEAAV
jgi:DNA mismatch repair protein MutS